MHGRAVDALLKLSEQCKTVNSSHWTLLMKFIAELQCSINAAISEVVNFLKDSDAKVCLATAAGLSELSDRKIANLSLLALLIKIVAEFQPLIITAIPELVQVTLPEDSEIDVCRACATALLKIFGHGKMGKLLGLGLLTRIIVELRFWNVCAVLDMVKSINDGDSNVRFALSKLSQQGKRVNQSSLACS